MVTSLMRRWKIRRLYNRKRWRHARRLCEHELETQNHDFATDIIVRSLYNEGLWKPLIDFTEQYPRADYKIYAQKAQRKLNQAREEAEGIPEPKNKKPWNVSDLLSNWTQEENRLWLRHPWGWAHWDMPEGYLLNDTHPALLHLALEVLLFPWVPETKHWVVEQRMPGANNSLSYSGGVDSTAAMLLLPKDTILAYHERNFTSMLNHSLPHSTFEAIEKRTGRSILCIPSNHEKIRTHHNLQTGFSTSNASAVHLILLADYLDLSSIAFGTPIDNTWLEKGAKYRHFPSSFYWNYWSEKFKLAGLTYLLPMNHISEAGALLVCKQSKLSDVVNSCLRGYDGRWCGRCWKCFHKNGPLGRDFDPYSKEVTTFLNAPHLRTAQHALWALKVQDLEHLAPHLKPHIAKNLDWWTQAYPAGLELVDEPLRSHIRSRTENYLEWMEEPFTLETIDLDV